MSFNSRVEPNVVCKAFTRTNTRFRRWLVKNPIGNQSSDKRPESCPPAGDLPPDDDGSMNQSPEEESGSEKDKLD